MCSILFDTSEARALVRQRGIALLLTLVVAFAVALTLAAAVASSRRLSRQARWHVDRTRALAMAEGILEAAQHQVLRVVAHGTSVARASTVSVHGAERPYAATNVGAPARRTGTDGVERSIIYYRLSASTEVGAAHATIHRVIGIVREPLFQHLLYWVGDLALTPAGSTTLSGRIHVDGDLWLGCGGLLTLDADRVLASGNILREGEESSRRRGSVAVRVRGEGGFAPMGIGEDSRHPRWSALALERWRGSVLDSAHGIAPAVAPTLDDIAFRGAYHARASLVVMDASASDRDGKPVDLPAGTLVERRFYDARAGTVVTVTDIDLSRLALAGDAFPAGGVLYAYRRDSTPERPHGIRLVNGAQLRGALTVVSENPVYVLGDYNSENPKPAAVIADAFHVLSASWTDSERPPQRPPAAVDTVCRLAVLAGHPAAVQRGAPSRLAALVRLHEDWTGTTLQVVGSFASPFESRFAWRDVGAARAYRPAVFQWSLDRSFTSGGVLPPAAPDLVTAERVLWEEATPLPFEL